MEPGEGTAVGVSELQRWSEVLLLPKRIVFIQLYLQYISGLSGLLIMNFSSFQLLELEALS